MPTKKEISPKGASRKGKGAASRRSPAQLKAGFKDELASRIESEHESAQYRRALNREDMELSLGVGDYDLFFKEFANHFRKTRIDKITKEEMAEPGLKIKEVSKLRWRKSRRKSRGKMKTTNQQK
jgi:hypothetical protein